MSKNEFLKKLKSALEVDLSQSQIYEQIAYYDNYISTEIKNGRSEQDVLDELGDPNLIAKTIKQVAPDSNVESNDSSYSFNNDSHYNNYNNHYNGGDEDNQDRFRNIFSNNSYRQYTGGIASCLIIGLIIFFVIYMVLRLFVGLLYGGLYLASYYPILLLVVILIIYLVNKGRNGQ